MQSRQLILNEKIFIELFGLILPKLNGAYFGDIVSDSDQGIFFRKLSHGNKIPTMKLEAPVSLFEMMFLRIFSSFCCAPASYITLVDKPIALAMIRQILGEDVTSVESEDYLAYCDKFQDEYICFCSRGVEGDIVDFDLTTFAKTNQSLPEFILIDGHPYIVHHLGKILALSAVIGDVDSFNNNILFIKRYDKENKITHIDAVIIEVGMALHQDHIDVNTFPIGSNIPTKIYFKNLPLHIKKEFVQTIKQLNDKRVQLVQEIELCMDSYHAMEKKTLAFNHTLEKMKFFQLSTPNVIKYLKHRLDSYAIFVNNYQDEKIIEIIKNETLLHHSEQRSRSQTR